MGTGTKIQWADHTFNCWRGCTKISVGCANCYAEAQSKRNPGTLGIWGPNGTRVVAAESMWRQPLKWDRDAERDGVRRRVFCASLADVFEDWDKQVLHSAGIPMWQMYEPNGHADGWGAGICLDDPDCGEPLTLSAVRRRLFKLIDATPNLDWLLVTKRPENIRHMWPAKMDTPCRDGEGHVSHDMIGDRCRRCSLRRDNVWLLTSISDQKTADEAIPHLLRCRDLCPVLGVSYEPAIGPVKFLFDDFSSWCCGVCGSLQVDTEVCVAEDGASTYACVSCGYVGSGEDADWKCGIDWIIVGGESGPNGRPCDIQWIRETVQECNDARVPCFVKQLGANPIDRELLDDDQRNNDPLDEIDEAEARIFLTDPKGGDMNEWPEDLRVREYPKALRLRDGRLQ